MYVSFFFFFFWLACPCLEGGLLGDPCRKGASWFCLYYWRSYSDWAAAKLGSLGWELWVRRCVFFPERKMYFLSLQHLCVQNGFRKDLFWAMVHLCKCQLPVVMVCCNVTFCNITKKKRGDQKNCLWRSNYQYSQTVDQNLFFKQLRIPYKLVHPIILPHLNL